MNCLQQNGTPLVRVKTPILDAPCDASGLPVSPDLHRKYPSNVCTRQATMEKKANREAITRSAVGTRLWRTYNPSLTPSRIFPSPSGGYLGPATANTWSRACFNFSLSSPLWVRRVRKKSWTVWITWSTISASHESLGYSLPSLPTYQRIDCDCTTFLTSTFRTGGLPNGGFGFTEGQSLKSAMSFSNEILLNSSANRTYSRNPYIRFRINWRAKSPVFSTNMYLRSKSQCWRKSSRWFTGISKWASFMEDFVEDKQ